MVEAHLAERFRAITPTSTRRRGNGARLCRLGLRGILLHGATYWLLFGQIEIDGDQGIPSCRFATFRTRVEDPGLDCLDRGLIEQARAARFLNRDVLRHAVRSDQHL